jgi:hypothetical protein
VRLLAKWLEARPAHAYQPWIRRLADYERRETIEIHGSRYG